MLLENMGELAMFLEENLLEKQLIGVKQAAEILQVSVNTVRRLADAGKLQCIKIKSTGYRKFNKSEVENFKYKFYQSQQEHDDSHYQQLSLIVSSKKQKHMKNISAKSHPAHYLMHKYWGRKPHNVIADYIKNYTEENDVVLDPFMGSGIVPIEAIKANRKGIGVDINPMSKFIAENTVSNVDLNVYESFAKKIEQKVSQKCNYLYETFCPLCGKKAVIQIAIWDNDVLARIRIKCPQDGLVIKDADSNDLGKIHRIHLEKIQLAESKLIDYPTDKVLKYVKRSGKESIDELFTDRALIILSNFQSEIRKVKNYNVQQLLLFTFTSMLANVSNMLPGDLEKATYKSGWVISKFWTPKVHTERNIFHCFQLRVKAIIKGKKEVIGLNVKNLNLFVKDSNHLELLENESVDYIFTDPPYGESIAYLALSQFWNSWLNLSVDYSNEIIIDSNRGKDYEDYDQRILKSFQEMYRVLKNNHYLSFTFHNRDLNVWKGVMDAVRKSGFVLQDITLQEQAVSSGTQGINKMNTLTGDFVYTLLKDSNKNIVSEFDKKEGNSKFFVEKLIDELIENNNGITPSKLYEKLIPRIVRSESYYDDNGKVLSIEKILENKYRYVENVKQNKIGDKYQWEKK
ncbi:DNA methyltransferase [Leuconostoc mesenteroides]|uniref:DNA methyltransferase n=2 Tax=Bacillati TaxID=1783272 RepID=UPI001CBFF761|nr:DNA methyltransferase [Leuconostoc mesenteroides]